MEKKFDLVLVVKEFTSYSPPRLRIHLKKNIDLDTVDFLLANTPGLKLWAVFQNGEMKFHSTGIDEG